MGRTGRGRRLGLYLGLAALISNLMLTLVPASAATSAMGGQMVVICSPDGPRVVPWAATGGAESDTPRSPARTSCADCPVCPPCQATAAAPPAVSQVAGHDGGPSGQAWPVTDAPWIPRKDASRPPDARGPPRSF